MTNSDFSRMVYFMTDNEIAKQAKSLGSRARTIKGQLSFLRDFFGVK